MTGRRENSFKRYLVNKMGTRWDVQSHEDKHSAGIPDLSFAVNGVNGWIELKQIVDYSDNMRPQKFTCLQINWLAKRGKHGGNCYVFVKVAKDYYLFDAVFAAAIAEGRCESWYRSCCIKWWNKSIDPVQLVDILTELGGRR